MTSETLSWVALGGYLLTCLAAFGAKLLNDFSRGELVEYCERRGRPRRLSAILDGQEQAAVSVEMLQYIGLVLMLVAGGAAQTLAAPRPTVWALSGAAGLALGLLLTGAVWIPWAVVRCWSAPLIYHTWSLWSALGWLLYPLNLGGWFFEAVFGRLAGSQAAPESSDEEEWEEEMRDIVAAGAHEGVLPPQTREMIEGVMGLGDLDVTRVMMPRSRVDALDIRSSWEETLRFVIDVGRTRLPVFEGDLDHIVGVLYVKDLFVELAKPPEEARRSLRELLRPAHRVVATKRLDEMLREFLRTRLHLAIVVNEYGGVDGVVTMEDVLEEIVGEISDETDEDEAPPIVVLDAETAELLGAAHVEEANEQLDVELPVSEEYDTVAGLVLARLGRIPKTGETVDVAGARLTVLEASLRKIEKLRLEKPSAGPEREASERK